jgi:hypothetical protein
MNVQRTIVQVEPAEDGVRVKLDVSVEPYVDQWVPRKFECDPEALPAWSVSEAVRAYGTTLFQKLASAHAAIGEALVDALKVSPGDMRPIYFHIRVVGAELLYWEALCKDDGSFLALDGRWPIGRIADSPTALPPPKPEFSPPLRMMAVLSALGIAADSEWQGLYDAVKQARQGKMPVKLTVLVGEEDLYDSIYKQREGDPDLQVEWVPETTADFEKLLTQFKPQLLHFFCHGEASFGKTQLKVASLDDWQRLKVAQASDQNGDTTGYGRVVLTPAQLMNIQANPMRDVWLVVLNCCEGGKATKQDHSIAHALVANGVPAAVGMMEPVDAHDAYEFCRVFYPGVLDRVRLTVDKASGGGAVPVEWVDVLHAPRTALRDRHANDPAQCRQWTLPVLYSRRDSFEVRWATPSPVESPEAARLRALEETVATWLQILPTDAAASARLKLTNP